MIVVTGRVHVAPENRKRFIAVATEMCSRSPRRTRVAATACMPTSSRTTVTLVEEWADDDALQRHFAQPHTTTFMGALIPLLAGPAHAVFHTVESSRKLDPERGLVALDRLLHDSPHR